MTTKIAESKIKDSIGLFQFRIALLLSPHHSEPIVSEPSLVISTLPGGAPASPPNIVRATAADPSRVSVSWEPGPFPNGPILSYVLQINQLPQGYTALKVVKQGSNIVSQYLAHAQHFFLSALQINFENMYSWNSCKASMLKVVLEKELTCLLLFACFRAEM